MQFSVHSTQGNQWRKLMWFYNDWKDDLNPLLSMHDLLVTDKGIYEELQAGFHSHLQRFMTRAIAYAEKAAAKEGGEPYRWYLERYLRDLRPDQLVPFRGILMLDSGGFVLGRPDSWPKMVTANNGPGRQVAALMENLWRYEQESEVMPGDYTAIGQEAQRLILEAGLRVQPDILIALDRVIHYEMPAHLKEWYIAFNMANLDVMLRRKRELPAPKPMFWAVLHPWGPALSEIKAKAVSRAEALRRYTDGYRHQLATIRRLEAEHQCSFDGFGLGSLVPVADAEFLAILGEAVQDALLEVGMDNRPLHAFGSTEPKARRLQAYGISSFDSTHHLVKARTRQAYKVKTGQFEKVSAALQCDCPICQRHRTEMDEFLEDRKGVKEVATVLIALHNYYTFEGEHLVAMLQTEEQIYPTSS